MKEAKEYLKSQGINMDKIVISGMTNIKHPRIDIVKLLNGFKNTLKQESNTASHLEYYCEMEGWGNRCKKVCNKCKVELCKHEGQEIPSKTIVCKHCKEIVTTTSVVIGI